MPDEQILAQATLEKNPIPSGGVLSPDQQRAKDIRIKMGEGKGLSAFDAAISSSQRVEVGARTKTLDANFGIDRDPTTGAKKRDAAAEPGSQDRYDRAQKALQQAEEILSVGLTTDRDALLANLESAMSVLPGYSDYLSTISDPNIRKAMVEDLLRNPKLMEKIRAGHDRVTAESARLKDEVTEAKKKADEAEAARVKKQGERDAVSGKGGTLDSARTAELSFADTSTAGAKGTELEVLQKDSTGAPRDLEAEERDALNARNRAKTLFDARNKRFADVQVAGKVPGNKEYDEAEGLLNVAQRDLSNSENSYSRARKDKARRTELEKEKAELPGKIRQLEADEIRLIGEYSDAEKAALIARADLNSKQVDRAAAEEAYASNAERVVPDALRDHLREQMHAADEANRALLDKMETDARTAGEKNIVKQIKERYLTKKRNLRGNEELAFDKNKAKEDVAFFMNGGTPDKMVQAALEATYGAGSPKVAEFMAKPDFVSTYGNEIVKQAFMRYVADGGKISAAQQAYIEAQPWGQGLIESALSAPSVKAKEKELKEKGLLPSGGFVELVKNNKGKIGLGILLMIAMGLLAPTAIPMIAGAVGAV